MAEITDGDLGEDYWATTEQVRDRFDITVQNSEPDFEQRITEATDAMQADWAEATGKAIPDGLPDSVPDLLQYATADLAASFAHLNFAQNVAGSNQDDQRHVFLEQRSDKMFSRWRQRADVDPGSEQAGGASDTVTGLSGTIGGDSWSPIERGD